MSYYDLGQTSEYTGNSPWCYSYEKSLNEPTDQFGPLLNTNVKTAMVNPCDCRKPLGPGAECAFGGREQCGPGLYCRNEGSPGQLGGMGVCSYKGRVEGMPCFGGARNPCGPDFVCQSSGMGGPGHCVPQSRPPRPHPSPHPAPRPHPSPHPAPRPHPAPHPAPRPHPAPHPAPRPHPSPHPAPRPHPAPHPRPGPDLSVTYCTDVSDDWCTDHFNPQRETCLMNCITLQKKDWPSGADSHVAACNSRFKFDPAGTRGNAGYAGGCTSNESEISHYFNKELGEYQECRMCSNDQFLCGGCPPSDHSGVY